MSRTNAEPGSTPGSAGLSGADVLDGWLHEDKLVPLSRIQHFVYCPRQWALIEREVAWEENAQTAQGRIVHESVHEAESDSRAAVHVETALPVWSREWFLIGVADAVVFHLDRIVPVETKRGPRKVRDADDLQVAAQAVCLREMFELPVESGFIFHHKSRRRREVSISPDLLERLDQVVGQIRHWRARNDLPEAPADERCTPCSLYQQCRPDLVGARGRRRWQKLNRQLFTPLPEPSTGNEHA